MRRGASKVLVALVLFAAPIRVLAAVPDTWQIGFGGSVATKYAYKTLHFSFGDVDEHMDDTFMGTVSVARHLNGSLSLQTSLDYVNQLDPGPGERSRMASLAVGLRALLVPERRAHPYVEAMPALYGAKWTDEFSERSISSLRPGVLAGMGVVRDLGNRVHLDLGVRGHLSSPWPGLHTYSP